MFAELSAMVLFRRNLFVFSLILFLSAWEFALLLWFSYRELVSLCLIAYFEVYSPSSYYLYYLNPVSILAYVDFYFSI